MIDSSGLVEYLIGGPSAGAVAELIAREEELAAPDVIVFEALAVLRRLSARRLIPAAAAAGAVQDLKEVPIELFPCMELRHRVWELRENLTAADALFVSLAEQLDEPFATADSRLVSGLASLAGVSVETRLLSTG